MINGHNKEYFLTFPVYNPSLVLYQNKIFIDSNKRPFFQGAFIRGRRLKEPGRLLEVIRYVSSHHFSHKGLRD